MWMVYFHVADIDAAMKRVEELGGRVVTQKMEAPDTGWFTVIEDPAGAVFYIMQLAKADHLGRIAAAQAIQCCRGDSVSRTACSYFRILFCG